MINALVHAPPLYIANVILPLASVSQSCTGYYPMYRVCKACPSTASQGDQTLCISNMDVGCSQWGFTASTMTPQHHTGSAIPHFPSNSPPPAHVIRHKCIPICPSTASQGAQTLCIHPIWMWEAVNGGFAASTMTPQHHTGSAIPNFS